MRSTLRTALADLLIVELLSTFPKPPLASAGAIEAVSLARRLGLLDSAPMTSPVQAVGAFQSVTNYGLPLLAVDAVS